MQQAQQMFYVVSAAQRHCGQHVLCVRMTLHSFCLSGVLMRHWANRHHTFSTRSEMSRNKVGGGRESQNNSWEYSKTKMPLLLKRVYHQINLFKAMQTKMSSFRQVEKSVLES